MAKGHCGVPPALRPMHHDCAREGEGEKEREGEEETDRRRGVGGEGQGERERDHLRCTPWLALPCQLSSGSRQVGLSGSLQPQ